MLHTLNPARTSIFLLFQGYESLKVVRNVEILFAILSVISYVKPLILLITLIPINIYLTMHHLKNTDSFITSVMSSIMYLIDLNVK